MLLRLGLGLGAAAIIGLFLWGAHKSEVSRAFDNGYRQAALDTKAALEEDTANKVAVADDAEKSVKPTPSDRVALIALCNSDEDCRERGQQ